MYFSPIFHQVSSPSGQVAVRNSRCGNIHNRLKFTVNSVKVGRGMVSVVHVNYNAVKIGDLGHGLWFLIGLMGQQGGFGCFAKFPPGASAGAGACALASPFMASAAALPVNAKNPRRSMIEPPVLKVACTPAVWLISGFGPMLDRVRDGHKVHRVTTHGAFFQAPRAGFVTAWVEKLGQPHHPSGLSAEVTRQLTNRRDAAGVLADG